jgi:hypothetical protein
VHIVREGLQVAHGGLSQTFKLYAMLEGGIAYVEGHSIERTYPRPYQPPKLAQLALLASTLRTLLDLLRAPVGDSLHIPLPRTTPGNYSYEKINVTGVRRVRRIWTFALMAFLLIPQSTWKTATWKQEELVGFEPVVELMQMIASAEEAKRETVSTALAAFMNQLTSFLREQGVPAETLERVIAEFNEAREAFLEERISLDEFGAKIATLARNLQTQAEERGVRGLPEELLQEIGLDPEAIEALRTETDLEPGEIVGIAERIAEEMTTQEGGGAPDGAPPEEAEPPEDEPPPEDVPPPGDNELPPDDEQPPEGEGPPPDDSTPPEDDSPPEDAPPPDETEPPGDDAPPPEDGPPPDDSGPPEEDVPPEDSPPPDETEPPTDEPPPDDGTPPDDTEPPEDEPPPDDAGPPPEDELPPEDAGP